MFIVLYLMSLTAAKLWCLQRESNLLSNTGHAAETTEQVSPRHPTSYLCAVQEHITRNKL